MWFEGVHNLLGTFNDVVDEVQGLDWVKKGCLVWHYSALNCPSSPLVSQRTINTRWDSSISWIKNDCLYMLLNDPWLEISPLALLWSVMESKTVIRNSYYRVHQTFHGLDDIPRHYSQTWAFPQRGGHNKVEGPDDVNIVVLENSGYWICDLRVCTIYLEPSMMW